MALRERAASRHPHIVGAMLWSLMVTACGDGTSDPGSVVGSGDLSEAITEAMFVERVRVDVPFEATIYNGQERQVRLYGEDNLLAQITVAEVEMGSWEIRARYDLAFEQHHPIEIEVPFIEMVSITVVGSDRVEFGDDPYEVWTEDD